MKSLLLIACSNRKSHKPGLLPAIERYDGVSYRVIRKAQREGRFPPNLDINILSAKFGLIDASTPIPYYDQRMDSQRSRELKVRVQEELKRRLVQTQYSEIYIDLGKDYLHAIEGLVALPESKLIFAEGRIGKRLGKLKQWLSLERSSL